MASDLSDRTPSAGGADDLSAQVGDDSQFRKRAPVSDAVSESWRRDARRRDQVRRAATPYSRGYESGRLVMKDTAGSHGRRDQHTCRRRERRRIRHWRVPLRQWTLSRDIVAGAATRRARTPPRPRRMPASKRPEVVRDRGVGLFKSALQWKTSWTPSRRIRSGGWRRICWSEA